MKRILALIILITSITACKKNKPVTYKTPVYQYFDNGFLTHFGSFRLFTRTGEITDAALVQKYRTEWNDYFYTPSSTFSAPEFKRFALVNNDSIINTSISPVAELKRMFVDEYDKFGTRFSEPVNDTSNIVLHIGKYQTHKRVTTPLGYTYFDVEKPVYFLKKVNDTLFFPIVRYIQISRTSYSVSFGADKLNNVFSPAGVNRLGPNDTLLIQSFDLGMKKVKE